MSSGQVQGCGIQLIYQCITIFIFLYFLMFNLRSYELCLVLDLFESVDQLLEVLVTFFFFSFVFRVQYLAPRA